MFHWWAVTCNLSTELSGCGSVQILESRGKCYKPNTGSCLLTVVSGEQISLQVRRKMFVVKSLVLVVAVCYLGHPKNLLIDWRAASRSGGEFQTKHGFQTCCLRPSRPSRGTDSWKLVSAQNETFSVRYDMRPVWASNTEDRFSHCLSEWFAASDTDVVAFLAGTWLPASLSLSAYRPPTWLAIDLFIRGRSATVRKTDVILAWFNWRQRPIRRLGDGRVCF